MKFRSFSAYFGKILPTRRFFRSFDEVLSEKYIDIRAITDYCLQAYCIGLGIICLFFVPHIAYCILGPLVRETAAIAQWIYRELLYMHHPLVVRRRDRFRVFSRIRAWQWRWH